MGHEPYTDFLNSPKRSQDVFVVFSGHFEVELNMVRGFSETLRLTMINVGVDPCHEVAGDNASLMHRSHCSQQLISSRHMRPSSVSNVTFRHGSCPHQPACFQYLSSKVNANIMSPCSSAASCSFLRLHSVHSVMFYSNTCKIQRIALPSNSGFVMEDQSREQVLTNIARISNKIARN